MNLPAAPYLSRRVVIDEPDTFSGSVFRIHLFDAFGNKVRTVEHASLAHALAEVLTWFNVSAAQPEEATKAAREQA